MTCSSDSGDDRPARFAHNTTAGSNNNNTNNSSSVTINEITRRSGMRACPSCGHPIKCEQKAGIHNLPGLPAGVKFDPSDQEILEHLEAKVSLDSHKLHPLIDEFIHTLEGEDGICYTHPEKLPGVTKDGLVRHFFHRPSKAYTTGTRKRRKVHTDVDGNETRWHKTGKTRPVVAKGRVKGYKKILVLYTNYGKQRKPEKTNWVMHQYHLGDDEDEKEGELVVSKVFYQTQPRQCGSLLRDSPLPLGMANGQAAAAATAGRKGGSHLREAATMVESFNPTLISFDQFDHNRPTSRLLPSFNIHDTSFIP